MEQERTKVQVSEVRCPYCHAGVPRGEEPVVCPSCHALHHEECLAEHGTCASCDAPHPRFAEAQEAAPHRQRTALEQVLSRLEGTTAGSGPYRLGLCLVGAVLLGAGIACGADPAATDLLIAVALMVAAGLTLAACATIPLLRSATRVAATFFPLLAIGLLASTLEQHILEHHRAETTAAALGSLLLGGLATWLAYREVFKPRPDHEEKGEPSGP